MPDNSSLAKQIANQLNTKFGITWVTSLLVQIFIVFSKPVRTKIYEFLLTQEAWLKVQMTQAVVKSQKWDTVALQLQALRFAMAAAMEPVQALLNIIPVDTIINEVPQAQTFLGNVAKTTNNTTSKLSFDSFTDFMGKISPDFANFLQTLSQTIPVKIPAAAISNTFGSGFDFFDGINSLSDLQNKIDDLTFRIARASAISTYAGAGSSYVSGLLLKVQVYIDLILTLNTNNI